MSHQRRLKKDLLRGQGRKHHRVPIIKHEKGKKPKVVGIKSLLTALRVMSPKEG